MSNSDSFSKVAADYDAVFNLIDVVFSLESCLQYQILPLELDGEHLILGMIDPRNKEAVKFVSPIIQSLGYTFHTQAIDTQTHQLVLAAYLKSSPNDVSSKEQAQTARQKTSPTMLEKQVQDVSPSSSDYNSATLVDIPEDFKAELSKGHDATLVDIPEDFKAELSKGHDATLVDIPEAAITRRGSAETVDISEESIAAKLIESVKNLSKPVSSKENQDPASGSNSNSSATLFELPEEIAQSLQDSSKLNDLNNSATLFELPEEIAQKLKDNSNLNSSNQTTKSPEESESESEIETQPNSKYLDDDKDFLGSANNNDEPIKPKSKKELKSNQTMVIDSAELEQLKIYSSTPQLNNLRIDTNEVDVKRVNQSEVPDQNPELKAQDEILNCSNPEILWQQLLSKIVSGQVDKLYFQHKENFGSILSSEGGAVSPLMSQIKIAVFKAVVNEIKVMAKLPLEKLDKYRKVAIPKLYKKERVLLRVEFFPSRFGEEITMQMLQGEALKFYQQRQADRTMEQAISLAKKLEKALSKMSVYQGSIELNDLTNLKAIAQKIEQKLGSLS